MTSEAALRRQIAETCRRLDAVGYCPGSAGNVSARLNKQDILITPTGSVLGEIKPADMVRVALNGRRPTRGRPSSELTVHALIYRVRADVGAVVHAHPPACVGFAVARKDFGRPSNFEVYSNMGLPQLVPFSLPGEAGPRLEPLLDRGDCFLLANHGVITVGPNLERARHRIEALENFACALLAARMLGGEAPFSRQELASIERFIERAGLLKPQSLLHRDRRRRSSP